jgi:hypothetical protein
VTLSIYIRENEEAVSLLAWIPTAGKIG